jgi:hypothetical protein
MIALIALGILVIAVTVVVLAVWISRRREKVGKSTAYYRTFFIMGIAWVPFSIVLMVGSFIFQIPFYIHLPLLILGLICLIIGLANRDKWRGK